MGFKETVKEKVDDFKEKVKDTKAYEFYKEHEKGFKVGGALLGVAAISAVSGAKQYKKGVQKGYHEGLSENALRARDRLVMNSTLDYISDAGEDGATFETKDGKKTIFKKVSEIREI